MGSRWISNPFAVLGRTFAKLDVVLRFVSGAYAGVRIDFGPEPQQKKLTITFNFISGLVGIIVAMTLLWSVAAGVLQAGRLLQTFDQLFAGYGGDWAWSPWAGRAARVAILIVGMAPVYFLKAFGVSMLLFLAAASVGAAIGFLFGVPRPMAEGGAPARAGAPAAGASPAADAPPATPGSNARQSAPAPAGWQANTNLTQISDWLTKIIVGVSLVEAHKIVVIAMSFHAWASTQLFGGLVGVSLVLPALIVAGFVLGFLYSYLFTQLFLALMMAASADEISNGGALGKVDAVVKIQKMSGTDPAVAAPIQVPGGSAPSTPEVSPTPSQTEAAISILSQPLDDLTDAESVLVWARSQALLNQWKAAMTGYDKLLTMRRRPAELAEAARVCASSNDLVRARTLSDEAVRQRDKAPAETRGPMTFDAAYLALYDPPPAGYTRAISLLDDDVLRTDSKGGLFVLRACANGQRLKFEGPDLTGKARDQIGQAVLSDLLHALGNPENLTWIRFLLSRDADGKPLPPPRPGETRDDDLDAFKDVPDLVARVGPQAARPAGP